MLAPLGVRQPTLHRTAVRTAKAQGVPRLLLVQCDRCGCNGSGKVSRTHRLVSTNLASTRTVGGQFRHACGGTLVAFDIEVGE